MGKVIESITLTSLCVLASCNGTDSPRVSASVTMIAGETITGVSTHYFDLIDAFVNSGEVISAAEFGG